ncbi:MAG: preprotein translocase subunit YajC [Alphaproteobacteria bacterium]
MDQANLIPALMGYLPIVLIFAVFYVLILRPQSLAAKAHAALVVGLKRGDTVLMASGLMAKVEKVEGTAMVLRINAEDTVLMAKASVERLLEGDETKLLDAQLSLKPSTKK